MRCERPGSRGSRLRVGGPCSCRCSRRLRVRPRPPQHRCCPRRAPGLLWDLRWRAWQPRAFAP
eukprot:1528997-Lingulodinium_polyedra.AAC.1